ncbi:hypothetical protein JCM8547_000133 [Rhodosporidiobolus lusitaniae]
MSRTRIASARPVPVHAEPVRSQQDLQALRRELALARNTVRSLEADATPSLRSTSHRVFVTKALLHKLDQLQDELSNAEVSEAAIAQHENHIDRTRAHLQTSLARAQENLDRVATPIMIDALLRYIASNNYPKYALNTSLNPADKNLHLKHYPTRHDIEWLEEQGHLTHVKNGEFENLARALDDIHPGWTTAYEKIVVPTERLRQKRFAEDLFSENTHHREKQEALVLATGKPVEFDKQAKAETDPVKIALGHIRGNGDFIHDDYLQAHKTGEPVSNRQKKAILVRARFEKQQEDEAAQAEAARLAALPPPASTPKIARKANKKQLKKREQQEAPFKVLERKRAAYEKEHGLTEDRKRRNSWSL